MEYQMKYQVTQAPRFLVSIDVHWHETGTLRKNNVALFAFYKTDSLTATQKARILEWCKDARFFITRKEYAPEIRAYLIAFPRAGFYRVGFSDKES